MKTLLIDNYDSFTFNIFQYLGQVNGEAPIVITNDEMSWSKASAMSFDNIVISPGPGHPECDRDFGLCAEAIREANTPVLGICLGHQGIGHYFGGKVHQAQRPMHGRTSSILHTGEGVFRGLPSPFTAVRYHSLVVDPALPAELEANAWTPDGIIMGLRHRTKPIWGVQFHPESICSEHGHLLLRNFRDLTFQATGPKRITTSGFRKRHSNGGPQVEKRAKYRVVYRRLKWFVEPDAVFSAFYKDKDTAFFLHSSVIREGVSRFSFMGDASGPKSSMVSYRLNEKNTIVRKALGKEVHVGVNIFDYLREELDLHSAERGDLPFDFVGGFVGYFGYELKGDCGVAAPHPSEVPDGMFIFADRFVAFDHVTREMYLVALSESAEDTNTAWFDEMEGGLKAEPVLPPLRHGNQKDPVRFRLQQSRTEYISNIKKAMAEIDRGETYEVCLTNKVLIDLEVDAFALYRTLQQINPAPFSSFLKFPEVTIISSSPERFLRFDAQRRVEAKPIKGTAKRSVHSSEDNHLAERLRTDEKSRSENLMIVDLLRNDLSRVCEMGSIRVPKLMAIESFATVHQLVSTIEGKLAKERSVVDGIRAAFPGGSMTGAPKNRTMEIIDQFEGAARGVYSGAIGYLSLNGTTDLSIVIRTIVAANGKLSIGMGGAIIALSNPADEFEETLLKANALVRAIAMTQRGDQEGIHYIIEGSE